MSSTATPTLLTQNRRSPRPWLPLSRDQYKTCHIYAPDLGEHLPAICVGQQFYSFLKVVKEQSKALDIVAKLFDSGDDALVTQCGKAYAVWVLESDVPASA